MVAVRNSCHYGIAGYYATMATKEGMIGITGTNARPSIAPTFGVENMLGTNPLTIGLPTDEDFPFVLDCATSITQRGKLEVLERLEKPAPEGWVIDQNGNFLIRKYSVVRNDGAALEGTEIIGWDPREHRIRSWTFNSDGSFGQNVWTQDGQAWMIVHTGTLGDGSDLAANYRVTPVDADTITIVSSDRCINGEPQPPLPEITMKRCIATDQQATPIEPPSQVLPQP